MTIIYKGPIQPNAWLFEDHDVLPRRVFRLFYTLSRREFFADEIPQDGDGGIIANPMIEGKPVRPYLERLLPADELARLLRESLGAGS